jgi:hypothetical protein
MAQRASKFGSKLGRATAEFADATGRSRPEVGVMLAAGLAAGGVALVLRTLKVLDALGSDITHRRSAR